MALGFSYRDEPFAAYWGTPDSNFNFCEEDYILSPWVAEVCNSITNLIYVLYAFHGVWRNVQKGHKDAFLRSLPYFGIASVGVGSIIFHATNRYFTQWADDLSMLVATATVIHRVYTFDSSASYTAVFGVVLTTALTAFATWHCWTDETHMHSLLFAIMILVVSLKTNSIIKARVADPFVGNEVARLAKWSFAFFAMGYGLWTIDENFCSTLTSLKRAIGMPLSFLLEFHGWWHLFTGVGAYISIALVEYLTSEEAGDSLQSRFAWPVSLLLTSPANEQRERSKLATKLDKSQRKKN